MWLAHADLYSIEHPDLNESETLKVLLENPSFVGRVVSVLVNVAEEEDNSISTKVARLHIALAESQGVARDAMQLAWLGTHHNPTTIFKILFKGDKGILTTRPETAIDLLRYNERVGEWYRLHNDRKMSLSVDEIADLLFDGRSYDESTVFIQKFQSDRDPKLMALAHQLRINLAERLSNGHVAILGKIGRNANSSESRRRKRHKTKQK